MDVWGGGHQQPSPRGSLLREGRVWEAREERVVLGGQGAGNRLPRTQAAASTSPLHKALVRSTRVGQPQTLLSLSPVPHPVMWAGRTALHPGSLVGTSVPSHCSWMRMRGHNRPALPSENSLAGEPTGEVEGAKNRDPRPTCLKSNLEALIPAQASPGPRPQPLPTDSGWQCLRCGPVVCTTFPERSGLLGRGSIFTFQGGRIPGVARLDQDGDTETQQCCFLYSKGGS